MQNPLLIVGLSLTGLWLAVELVTITLADKVSAVDPERALLWRSGHSESVSRLAEAAVDDPDMAAPFESAAGAARAAIVANPINIAAVRALALAQEAEDPEGAASLMRQAAVLSRRDIVVDAWLFREAAGAGEFGEALNHIDAILRTRPNLVGEVMPALFAFAESETARSALANHLHSAPPWRAAYLAGLSRSSDDPGSLADLYTELMDGPAPLSNAELSTYLRRLIEEGRPNLAYLLFARAGPSEVDQLDYVYNGHFEYPLAHLPFSWQLTDVQGAQTRILASEDGEEPPNHVLAVSFFNTRVPYGHAAQLLLLPPGGYRLSGRYRAQNLDNDRGLQWLVSCEELVGETERFSGTVGWTNFASEFSVPTSCPVQELRLVLPSRAPAEQQISGEIWFDDLAIERVPLSATDEISASEISP